MAYDDLRKKRLPPGAAPYRPISAGLQDIVSEFQRAGGGAQGAGAAVRSVLGQVVNAPMAVSRNAVAGMGGALNTMAQPFRGFATGLIGTDPQRTVLPPAPVAVTAPNNFSVPAGLFTSDAQRRALFPDETGRLSPDGQIARAVAASTPPRHMTPDGPPVYNTGSSTSGTFQVGNRAMQTIPSNYGAGRTNVVPSYVPPTPTPTRAASSYNPASALNFTPVAQSSRPNGASTRAEARSQQMDSMLQQVIQQAQDEPRSYGELFARKGTLAALSALGPLAQAAGSNYVQGVSNELQADTARYGIDTGYRSRYRDQDIALRGQDIGANTAYRAQDFGREGDSLRATIAREGHGVTTEGNKMQAAAIEAAGRYRGAGAATAAQIKAEADAQRLAIENPEYALEQEITTGYSLPEKQSDGTYARRQLTPEELQEKQARWQAYKFSPVPNYYGFAR